MTASLTKPIFLLVIVLCLAGALLTPVYSYSLAESDSTGDLSTLPLTFPAQSPEVIGYFNDIARPDDLVSFPDRLVQALPEVKAGQRMVSFASWEDAEKTIPTIVNQIEWVLYNPEHWENTPTSEQENLPATVQKAAKFLHDRDLFLFLAPDRRYVDEALDDLALHADALMLQGQRLQNDPEIFTSWMNEKIKIARATNPEILIYVQVGANRGTPEMMLSAIQTVAVQIDGIAIWSVPNTLDILKDFIALLRPNRTTSPTPTGMASETLEQSQTLVPLTTIPVPTTTKPGLTPKTTSPTSPSGITEIDEPSPSAVIATPQLGTEWISNENVILIVLSVLTFFLGMITVVILIILKKNREN